MSAGRATAVDYEHLHAQAAGDRDVMREVLDLFILHTAQIIEGLEAADNPTTWRTLTHTLKGSARGVGAFAVADAAAAAEAVPLDRSRVTDIRVAFEAARRHVLANPL
jgi:HPt (histidine-containing phosphotransfer) domain-containing protein